MAKGTKSSASAAMSKLRILSRVDSREDEGRSRSERDG